MIDGNMASTEAATVRLSVDEIAAMSDAELGQFMTKHRCPDGGYELPVDGWDKLSKNERNRLAEKLKTQERDLAQSPTACSRPLDLDDLNARLSRVPADDSFSLRPEPGFIEGSESATPPFDPEVYRTRSEIEAYHELVDEGGRPLYPVGLIQDIFRDPDSYAVTLRPWQENISPVSPSGIFQRQLQRWRDFRKWQTDNRGRQDDDGGFPAYVERQKYTIQQDCIGFVEWQKYIIPRESRKQAAAEEKETTAKRLAEIEADPSCLKSGWDVQQLLRERQRRLCRERGCQGFRDYAEAVKRRLTRHDFTQLFKLDEDPKKQDKLTTWIEYLNYEYWWLDKHISDIERLEPEHDKLWQELVDKNILRPHETKEFVRTDASGMERETEKDQAIKAVQRIESRAKRTYMLTQEDPKRLHIPKAKRIAMLKHGAEELLAAKRRLEQARRRSHLIVQFVRATFDYDEAKRDAARHRVLVQWVLDQVPLIESEVKPSKALRPGSNGRTRTKRRRNADEGSLEGQSPKRVRFDVRECRLANTRVQSKATETQAEPEHPAASSLPQDDAQAMLEGPRRSPRIAARRDVSRIAVEPKISQLRSRSKSEATAVQPSRPHSQIQDTKARRQSRSGNQGGIAKSTRSSPRASAAKA
ncbi:hypothetical protein H9Q72_014036 [Fusarium xylarioides]|uniref:Ankyrin 2,3/unc44 n=1 Tax=Fusarium xylarioides TaxID=221167 RepID=A0A9P7HKH8_9HYPO|nr:hypothetical protein H9Q70_014414 [Fusarium xylarioides]KAG5757825.1 hypothetical protein H9Q72_014036 [Fusarium xylarioides]KAG5768397.1 hypothetical protein H9Q73_013867 [Fusarium xylarioides]